MSGLASTLLELWFGLTAAGLLLLAVVVAAQAAVGHLRRRSPDGSGPSTHGSSGPDRPRGPTGR